MSPIWPSPGEPSLGAFVQVIAEGLEANGWRITRHATAYSARGGMMGKFIRYGRLSLGSLRLVLARPGVVFVHLPTWFSIFLWPSRLARRLPVVINLHGSEIHARKRLARLAWPLTRRYIKASDLVIVPSETFAAAVREATGVKAIFVSPSGGVKADRFRPLPAGEARRLLGVPADAFVLGFVSRIVEGKGWRAFLDAVETASRSRPEVLGLIVGEGSDKNLLLKEVRRRNLDDNIRFCGAVYQSELPSFYNAMDVFLFTSKIQNVDTLGLVAVEAMSCGTPVVAIDSPLTREYLSPGRNGEFAAEHDGSAIADAALRIAAWHKGDADSRVAVVETVRRFASEGVARSLSEQMKKLASRDDA